MNNDTIRLATEADLQALAELDPHIPPERLEACVREGWVYVLYRNGEGGAPLSDPAVGLLRYSLFWQTIPFLDLLFLREPDRGHGHGRRMMARWEHDMARLGYRYVMLSTQADETAQFFYERLGYQRVGAFLPPEQEADELMFIKKLSKAD